MYSPDRFGTMIVGDMLDAMAGFNEKEGERVKSIAEVLRMSTSILWNIQVAEKDRLKAMDLWPFSWDKREETKVEVISAEEKSRRQQAQNDYLNKLFPHNG